LTFKQLRALIASVLENPGRKVAAESMMPERAGPEGGDVAEAAARLEAALERIAHRAAEAPPGDGTKDPRIAEAATRLEALIATLRGVLAKLD
jgi:hypothetical protein